MQYLLTWQYARFSSPANPSAHTNRHGLHCGHGSRICWWFGPAYLGMVFIIPTREAGLWAAFLCAYFRTNGERPTDRVHPGTLLGLCHPAGWPERFLVDAVR